jgi:predicted RND superfamily exporter protein
MMDGTAPSWLKRITAILIDRRRELALLVLLSTALAAYVSRGLEFDQSIDSLYAADDPHLQEFLESKQYFGGDEFAFVTWEEPQLFEPNSVQLTEASRQRIRELSAKLSDIPGVRKQSTQDLERALRFPYGRRKIRQLMQGVLVDVEGKVTAVAVRLEPESSTPVPRAETILQIRMVADKHTNTHDVETYIVGEPVQIHEMFRIVERDGDVLFRVSFALLALVIYIFFRSLRWVFLPLLVVLVTIFWTKSILVASGLKLSMVSSMLNSLVTIIAVATVTHVTVHFRELRQSLQREEALRQTLTELLPAIFWTCATTAVGFAALLSSHITPVRSFGLMMALASGLVFVAAVCLLPGAILLGSRGQAPGNAPAEGYLGMLLARITISVRHHPRIVAAVAVGITLFAAAGLRGLEVETDFSKNFRKTSPTVRSLDFVETRLGGAGTWEVNFPAPKTLDSEYLARVRRLAGKLRNHVRREHPNLTKVVSLPDGLGVVPEKILFKLDLDTRMGMLSKFQPEFVPSMYDPENGRMRIVLRAVERQRAEEKDELIAAVLAETRKEFPDAKATGLFVLLKSLIQSLLSDQVVSFALAACGITLMMAIAFRSVRIGLISIVPNLMPIVLVVGCMGWTGLPINIATAMIASVSMGLTVDSTVHFIAGFRRARARGASIDDALHETHQGVGRALVFANVALIVGFLVLTVSEFIPLAYFGLLVSVAMLGGLLGNLFLLPVLLACVDGRCTPVVSETHTEPATTSADV